MVLRVLPTGQCAIVDMGEKNTVKEIKCRHQSLQIGG